MSFLAQVFCRKYQYIDVVSIFGDQLQILGIDSNAGGLADFYIGKIMNAHPDFKVKVSNTDKFLNMVYRHDPEPATVKSDISWHFKQFMN